MKRYQQLAALSLFLHLVGAPVQGQPSRYDELTREVQSLYEQGALAGAEARARETVSVAESEFGAKDPKVAHALNDLAGVLTDQGKLQEAEQHYRKALNIREEALGPKHPEVATSLNNLAFLLSANEQYEEAERLFKRALSIWESSHGDQASIATVLNNLAELYVRQERYDTAEPLFRRALAIRAKALGPKHPQLAVSYNNLAYLFSATAHYKEAIPLYQQAIAIIRNAKGNEHPDVATSLQNLAEAQQELGQLQAAEESLREATAIRKKALPDSAMLAVSLKSMSEVLILQHRTGEAATILEEVIALEEKLHGVTSNEYVSALHAYGDLLLTEKKLEDAQVIFRQAVASSESETVDKGLRIASLERLATVLFQSKKYSAAEPLYRRATELHQKLDGDNSLVIAAGLIPLAQTVAERGDYAEAKQLLERSLELRTNLLGIEHPEVGVVYGELGKLAQLSGDKVLAEKYFLQDITIAEKAFGHSPHPDVATAKYNLAQLYFELDRTKEGMALLDEARQIAEKSLGPTHPFVQELDRRGVEVKQ